MDELFEKNKIRLQEEYKIRQVRLESLPTNLEILVSTQCNLNCFMCSFGVYKNKFVLNISQDIYNRLKVLYPYLENLKLNGAEIFYNEETNSNCVDNILSDSLNFKNMKLAGTTNGILIGKKRAEIIAEKFGRLELSIDSPHEEIYRSIRIGANLEDFVNNINMLNSFKKNKGLKSKDNPHLNFSAIVMERTYKDIPKLVNLIADLGGCSLGLRPLTCDLKESDWDKIKNEDIFTDKEKVIEWKNILKEAQDIAKKKEIELLDYTYFHYSELYPEFIDDTDFADENEAESDNNIELCSCPWDNIYIGSKGYVSFALCSRMIIGDLNKSRFIDIWNGKVAHQERKRFISNNYLNCSKNCAKNYYYAGTIIQKEDLYSKIKKKFVNENKCESTQTK